MGAYSRSGAFSNKYGNYFFISLLNVISCGTFGKKMFYHLQQGNDKSDQKISP